MLLRCHVNQAVAGFRDVLFLPRDHDVQFGADCRVVLLLPREYVVDGTGGYIEEDLDSCLLVVNGLIVFPSNHGRAFANVAKL